VHDFLWQIIRTPEEGEKMPYCRRMDWPGALHHVISRGVNGMNVLADSCDKRRMMKLLERYVPPAGAAIHAWALMDNHFHFLVQTGDVPLSTVMQKFLTAYAMGFNLSRCRLGRVFMGRYRSILVDAEDYYFRLVAYINANPYRAGIVQSLEELESYPYAGHAYGSGSRERYTWEYDSSMGGDAYRVGYMNEVKRLSHPDIGNDCPQYSKRLHMATLSSSGISRGDREEGSASQMGYEKQNALGSNTFIVEALKAEAERRLGVLRNRFQQHRMAERGLEELCRKVSISPSELRGAGRRRSVVEIRDVFIRYLILVCGFTFSDAARYLGRTRQAISASFYKTISSELCNILQDCK
jgi:putative transposase